MINGKNISGYPKHWEVRPFSDVVNDSTAGNHKIPTGDYLSSGALPIIDQGQQLIGGYTSDGELKAGVELPAIIFGDHTRVFKFIDFDFAIGADGAKILEPKNGVKLDKRFLFHYLNNIFIESAGYSRHFKFLKEMYIPLPPLEEQKRIASILDKADVIRRKRQQAIKLADDFLRSVFLEMFGDPVTNPKGWEQCKFEDLTNMVTYGLTVRPEYIDDGIPLISAKEIRSGTINLEICSRISEADLGALSSKARPNYGDILFSKTGSIGHCALVDTVEPFAITQNAARVVPNSKRCVSHFLLGLLRTKYFYNLANKEAKGNAVKDLQLGVMKSFPVYAPPLELQKKYSEIFQKFTGQSLLQEEALKQAEESFNSLNQKAFLGEL